MHVLIVDDDVELNELVSKALTRDGDVVAVAIDLADARSRMYDGFDVVVLDLGLPDGSGIDLCKELRALGQRVPILLLTAQSAVEQRVAGLNAGADDYLVKPFALAELRARIRALGRRRERPAAAAITSGPVELDLGGRRARRDGVEVELTPREWSILESLVQSRGRVVSRDRLMEEGWGDVSESAAASLEVLVGRIRRKLGRALVRTIRGQGYALD